MRTIPATALAMVLAALPLSAQSPVASPVSPAQRVAADAMVIDRVAEASLRDLPRELLSRIADEDLEVLRGRRADGSYQYAYWARFEGGRVKDAYSIQARKDRMDTVELKGSNVYRILLEIPEHRLVVRKNRPIWIERVDLEYVGGPSSQSQTQSFDVKAWLQPGESRSIDLPVIARQATATVVATADPGGGYGNVEVTLIEGRIVDNADSPYAGAVARLKAVQRSLKDDDALAICSAAQRLRDAAREASGSTVGVVGEAPLPSVARSSDSASRIELRAELQLIEDLLTGSEAERRDGMDRLHQLIRKIRE